MSIGIFYTQFLKAIVSVNITPKELKFSSISEASQDL